MLPFDKSKRLIVPKEFVSGVRVANGPLAGHLARPCLCGQRVEPGEPAILIGNSLGEMYIVHPEHAPVGVNVDESEF